MLAVSSAPAQPATAPATTWLTIYSSADPASFDPQEALRSAREQTRIPPGFGVVRQRRQIDLKTGLNTLSFTDVAAGIDPTTVRFQSITAPGTAVVIEQNFEFDLASPEKMLNKYVGKDILINRRTVADDKTRTTESKEGRLLAYDQQYFVLETRNRQMPIEVIPRNQDLTEIKLFELSTGLMTRPTLLWKIQAQQPGSHEVQVSYQTTGLTWRADYSLHVNKDQTTGELSAWVSLLNTSGASYSDAQLKLVAGDVQVKQKPRAETWGYAPAAKEQFAEKSFDEYHLYTLDRPTSLANNSTKQLELFAPRGGIQLVRQYVYQPVVGLAVPYGQVTDQDVGTQSDSKVDVYLRLENTAKAGLGLPLPAGRVRVYRTDDGQVEFVGEDYINHTPVDQGLSVRTGSAFDLRGQRTQTDFKVDTGARRMSESVQITLTNHKKEPVRMLVREPLYRAAQWTLSAKSDDFEKIDARTIQFAVDLPASGKKTITYTVAYTW